MELLRDNKDIQTGDRKGLYRATARGCEKAGLKYKPKGLATARVPQSSYQVLQAIEMVSNRPGAGDFLNIQRSTTC